MIAVLAIVTFVVVLIAAGEIWRLFSTPKILIRPEEPGWENLTSIQKELSYAKYGGHPNEIEEEVLVDSLNA